MINVSGMIAKYTQNVEMLELKRTVARLTHERDIARCRADYYEQLHIREKNKGQQNICEVVIGVE